MNWLDRIFYWRTAKRPRPIPPPPPRPKNVILRGGPAHNKKLNEIVGNRLELTQIDKYGLRILDYVNTGETTKSGRVIYRLRRDGVGWINEEETL